jgi:CheY-like chemotaxis protein
MDGPALRILCVEDHHATAQAMCKLLHSEGHRVTPVDSVASAIKSMTARDFNLLIADIGLPDGSGLELAPHWRTHQPHQPCIALTGHGMPDDIERVVAAGFDQYLIKPILLEALLDTMRRVHPAHAVAPRRGRGTAEGW